MFNKRKGEIHKTVEERQVHNIQISLASAIVSPLVNNTVERVGTSASGKEMHSYINQSFSFSSRITAHVNCFKPFCREALL
jgi:hypothetical protein